MRYTGTRGYSGYRGRRPDPRRWIVLILALVLAAALVFLAIQRYMVFDKGGSFHFELPWRSQPSEASGVNPVSNYGELEIVIEDSNHAEAGAGESSAASVPMLACELEGAALEGEMTRALQALDPTYNSVAVRLKDVSGDLLYPSALPEAQEAGAVAGSSIASDALTELDHSGFYTVARLSALHDSRYSFAHMTDAAVQQVAYQGYIWYAPDSSFYLAPEKEAARQYLCAIAAEVADLGFDELLFDEFCYPSAGRLDNIDVSRRTMSREDALALLADNLRGALEGKNVRLSVQLDAQTVLNGANEKSGQSLSVLAARFDRIYVETTEEELPLLQSALAPYDAELVPILSAPPAAGPCLVIR